MRINNNINSLNIQGQLLKNNSISEKNMQKISSGLKINTASDNAAGLSISEKMKMMIRGLQKATRNSQDGISMVQVADGAMKEVQSMLDRAYELTIKAVNDTNNIDDKNIMGNEVKELIKEIDSIYQDTEFNEIKVLQGSKEKIITKYETIIEKVMVEEKNYETKGEMPSFITSDGFNVGYLSSNIKMDEIMYDRVTEKITFVDVDGTIKEVEQFKTSTGTVYKKGDSYKTTSLASETLEITGDDGITYTIKRRYDKYTEMQEHASDMMDFTNVNSANINDLVGTGFQTTCCSCNNRYSIKFVDDTESTFKLDGKNYIYSINISGVSSGDELVSRIIDGIAKASSTDRVNRVDEYGNTWDVLVPGKHLTGISAEKDTIGNNTGKLLIYDFPNTTYKRRPNPSMDMGIIKSGYYESTSVMVEKEVEKIIATETKIDGKDIELQIGANNGDIFKIDLPDIGLDAMKLDGAISFDDNEEITKFIELISEANEYVSKERVRMGVYENSLEYIINNNSTAHYNLQYSQSRINDADIAKEILLSAKYDIFQKSMYALLSQSNEMPNQVLQLLKV